MKVHVRDINADENYWEGVRNADLLGARELKSAEKRIEKLNTNLRNAQHLLSKYATENIELQGRVERLTAEVDSLYRKQILHVLYGQLTVLIAYAIGYWL